jgi:hypothetical protein
MRVYAKHYVRQRQNNLTTFFNFNEREIMLPNVFNRQISKITLKTFPIEMLSLKLLICV